MSLHLDIEVSTFTIVTLDKRCLIMDKRKEYSKPSVKLYGAVEEITRQGGVENRDDPDGPVNTAYS